MEPPPIYRTGVNLWITTYCNKSCTYCFGNSIIDFDKNKAQHISMQDLETFIDWLKRSPFQNEVQIMGGEPTLHPKFLEVINFLKNENINVRTILTNGLAERETYRELMDQVNNFLFNINLPKSYSDSEWELLNENLSLLEITDLDEEPTPESLSRANRLTLSITFYEPDQPYEYILDLAKKYNPHSIRFAPAKPSPDLSNCYVDFGALREVKDVLVDFVHDSVQAGFKPNLDCILFPCLFTVEEWIYLHNFVQNMDLICSPAFEVFPDLQMSYCSCNYDVLENLDIKGDSRHEKIIKSWDNKADEIRNYELERCKDCRFFEAQFCQGECLRLKMAEMEENVRLEEHFEDEGW